LDANKLNYGKLAGLVVLAQQGDEHAFATLYAATVKNQLAFATAFLKDPRLAEDAVQEAYISLYKSLAKLKDPKTLVAYLNRINFNTCVNIKKKHQRISQELQSTQQEGHGEEGQNVLPQLPEYGDPARYYDDIELKNELSMAVDKLPDIKRAAIMMFYYQNMTIKEIAIALNCSDRTVKRQLSEAKNALRHQLLFGRF